MGERVEIIRFTGEYGDKIEVIKEGTLIKFFTRIHGSSRGIDTQVAALVQFDDGTFRAVFLDCLRIKK